MDGDGLIIEGLAAQLYVQAANGGYFAWWHVLNDDVKRKFREQAKRRIADFEAKTTF